MRNRSLGFILVAILAIFGMMPMAGPARADTLPDAYTQIVNHQVPIQPDGASTQMSFGFGRYYTGPNGFEVRFSGSGSANVVLSVLGVESLAYGTALTGSISTLGGVVIAAQKSDAIKAALTTANVVNYATSNWTGDMISQAAQNLVLHNQCIGVTVPPGALDAVLRLDTNLVTANIAGLVHGVDDPTIKIWVQPCEAPASQADFQVPVYLPGVANVVAAQPTQALTGNPVGFLDDSGMTAGKLYVRGWAIDPDTTSAITVNTYVDGNLVGATTANTSRPDVGTAYPGYGDNHGYYAEYMVGVGTHQVCTYAINTGAGDGNPQLPSCKSVQVVDPNPDYNGDGFTDLAILHQVTDGGADLHMLFGSTSPLSNSGTWLRSLAGSAGWSWSNMKAVTGDFNGNGYQDLAILHKRTDGGADIHVLYGGPGSSPLGNTTTITRSLPSADGWDWTKMKVTVGDYNGDHFSDLAILHQTADGGADVHILFGGTAPFANTTTWLRSLPATSGWNWSQMKLASGDFNGNGYADLAIVHQRSDGGADVHVLYGGPGSSPLGNTTTITRSLPGPSWDWTKMKVTAGDYNGDHFSDLAILHQTSDGGSDVHLLFGGTSPFGNTTTWLRSLTAASGWNWSQMKIESGDFNGNGYADLAIVHQRSDGGADVHVLYGGPGSSPLGNTTTITRSLPGPSGWDWTKMLLAPAS